MNKRLFAMPLFVIFATPVFAVTAASNLYKAEVSLAAQTEDLKEQAVREGLLQVLRKVTNNPQIEMNRVIKASLRRADYYVQEYNYSIPTPASAEYIIHISYEKEDIDRLLKKAAPFNTTDAWVKLKVKNVGQQHDLSNVMAYVKQLDTVKQVQLSQVSGKAVDLNILVRGSLAAFQQHAAINKRLILQSQNLAENTLVYEWVH